MAYTPSLSDLSSTEAKTASLSYSPKLSDLGEGQGKLGTAYAAGQGVSQGTLDAAGAMENLANNILAGGAHLGLLPPGLSQVVKTMHPLIQAGIQKGKDLIAPKPGFEQKAIQENPNVYGVAGTVGNVGTQIAALGTPYKAADELVSPVLNKVMPGVMQAPIAAGAIKQGAFGAAVGAAGDPDHPLVGAAKGLGMGMVTGGLGGAVGEPVKVAGQIIHDTTEDMITQGKNPYSLAALRVVQKNLKDEGLEYRKYDTEQEVRATINDAMDKIRPNAYQPGTSPLKLIGDKTLQQAGEADLKNAENYKNINEATQTFEPANYKEAVKNLQSELSPRVGLPKTNLVEPVDEGMKNTLTISAAKSNLTSEANAERTADLERTLRQEGIKGVQKVNGQYLGDKETSFNLPANADNEALVQRLQTKYKQDSYLHVDENNNALIKDNGNVVQNIGQIAKYDKEPQNVKGYTQIGDNYFSAKQQPTLNEMLSYRRTLDGTIRQAQALEANGKITHEQTLPYYQIRQALNQDIHQSADSIGLKDELANAEQYHQTSVAPFKLIDKQGNIVDNPTAENKIWTTLSAQLQARRPNFTMIRQNASRLGPDGKELLAWGMIENALNRATALEGKFKGDTMQSVLTRLNASGLLDELGTQTQKDVALGASKALEAADRVKPAAPDTGVIGRYVQTLTHSRPGIALLRRIGSPSTRAQSARSLLQQLLTGMLSHAAAASGQEQDQQTPGQ